MPGSPHEGIPMTKLVDHRVPQMQIMALRVSAKMRRSIKWIAREQQKNESEVVRKAIVQYITRVKRLRRARLAASADVATPDEDVVDNGGAAEE